MELGVNLLNPMKHASIFAKSEGIFLGDIDFNTIPYTDSSITYKPQLYASWYDTLAHGDIPTPSTESLNLAVANFSPINGQPKANLINITRTMKAAYEAHTNLLVFPQMSLSGYSANWNKDVLEALAETVPGPSTETLAAFCKQYNLYIGIGLLEKDVTTDYFYNTVVFIGPTGIIDKYRQIHLTKAEKAFLTEGDTPTIVETPWGKIGLSTGIDTLNSIELIRYYTGMGCQIILNPTMTTPTANNHTVLEYLVDTNSIYILTAAPYETNNPDALRTSSSTIIGPKYASTQKDTHIERIPYYIDYYAFLSLPFIIPSPFRRCQSL
ncbi:carbon-nitrogen hydrolase family protein [Cellulosilyticum ruminicola]|uniref:carbon-nitrogen hydrolase family protein n=1 Tax=Cellulosilyticum ruminicola TaxID=425254 RepID=UPI00155DBA49|nr:carbon-nitrogen hydrolase family protein [Cellulosilyticum ruminicola]